MNNIESNNEKLRLKVKDILLLEIGLSIEVTGNLYIRELDNGDYAVGGNDGPHLKGFIMPKENELWPCWEEEFEDIDEAIEFFVNKRAEYNLGLDFEQLIDD